MPRFDQTRVMQSLTDIELEYTSRDCLLGDERYASLDEVETPGITRWSVAISVRPTDVDDEPAAMVGDCSVVIFDLDSDADLVSSADEIGADVHSCAAALLPEGTLDDELADQVEPWPSRLLFLEHMVIDPEYRGRGIGPACARAIVRRLAGPFALVVGQPQPDGWEEMDADALQAARGKLEATWGGIGLRRWRDTPYWICPADDLTYA